MKTKKQKGKRGNNMTTIEKIERMDELMEKYGVNDVYSLIEVMEKESYPELAKALEKGKEAKEKLNSLIRAYGWALTQYIENPFDEIFNGMKAKNKEGKLYYISIKELKDEDRASGMSRVCVDTGNLFSHKEDAEKVLEIIFKGE